MRYLLIIFMCMGLSGCGWFNRGNAYLTGYSKECINGVMYYQFYSGATVAYDKTGKVLTCN